MILARKAVMHAFVVLSFSLSSEQMMEIKMKKIKTLSLVSPAYYNDPYTIIMCTKSRAPCKKKQKL